MLPLSTLIFDWSGTLVDDLPPVVHATNAVLTHCGKPTMTRDEFVKEFELPFARFYERVIPGVELESLEPVFHEAFDQSGAVATPLDHAENFLKFCQLTGRRCFVLSSALERHLLAQAEAFGWSHYFEAIYAGVRDKTEMIHHIIDKHELQPERTAFVGDMTHDIDTAHHGGVMSVAVLTGYQDVHRLAGARPDVVVRDLARLQRLMRTE